MRVGMGYDVHRLVEDRDLIIGGVKIPYEKGLLGHSDADVLLHAIMDALLGAAALGDIGKHFPDSDPKYKGADSLELLKEVAMIIDKEHFAVENIDATIIAQAPKMRPYIDEMRINIAQALAHQEITHQGGQLKIASLQAKPRVVFDITKVYRIFDIYDDVETAISSFK